MSSRDIEVSDHHAHPAVAVALAMVIAVVVAIGVGLNALWPESPASSLFANALVTPAPTAPARPAQPQATPLLIPPTDLRVRGLATVGDEGAEVVAMDKQTVVATVDGGSPLAVTTRDTTGDWTWVLVENEGASGWVQTQQLVSLPVAERRFEGHLLEDAGVPTPLCSSEESGAVRAAPGEPVAEAVKELAQYECSMVLDESQEPIDGWLPVVHATTAASVSGWIDGATVVTRRDMLKARTGVLKSTVLDQQVVLGYVAAGKQLPTDLRRPTDDVRAALAAIEGAAAGMDSFEGSPDSSEGSIEEAEAPIATVRVVPDVALVPDAARQDGYEEPHYSGCYALSGPVARTDCLYAVTVGDAAPQRFLISSVDEATDAFRPEATITTAEELPYEGGA